MIARRDVRYATVGHRVEVHSHVFRKLVPRALVACASSHVVAVEESGTQGPDAIDAGSFPITSDAMRQWTRRHCSAIASRPAPNRRRRLRTAFMSSMSAPDASSAVERLLQVRRGEAVYRRADEARGAA